MPAASSTASVQPEIVAATSPPLLSPEGSGEGGGEGSGGKGGGGEGEGGGGEGEGEGGFSGGGEGEGGGARHVEMVPTTPVGVLAMSKMHSTAAGELEDALPM